MLFDTPNSLPQQTFNVPNIENTNPDKKFWLSVLGYNNDGTRNTWGDLNSWGGPMGIAEQQTANAMTQGTNANAPIHADLKNRIDKFLVEGAVAATVVTAGGASPLVGAAGAGLAGSAAADAGAAGIGAGAAGGAIGGAVDAGSAVTAGDIAAGSAATVGDAGTGSGAIAGMAPETVGSTDSGTLSHLFNQAQTPSTQNAIKGMLNNPAVKTEANNIGNSMINGQPTGNSPYKRRSNDLSNYNNY